MDKRVETGRDFWRAVLLAGGEHFFDVGGASLSAVKFAIALNRAVSLKGIAEHPILADMAELLHRAHAPELLTSSSGRN
jgi:hypothetical protein